MSSTETGVLSKAVASCDIEISVQEEDFDLGKISDRLTHEDVVNGAQVFFVGRVREFADVDQQSMTLEHYPGMTEKSLTQTAEIASERWRINKALIIHRVGELKPSDQIVLVMVLSAHREDAFNAAWFIMDHLKTTAPFWKKESVAGKGEWVDAKDSDDKALDKWNQK